MLVTIDPQGKFSIKKGKVQISSFTAQSDNESMNLGPGVLNVIDLEADVDENWYTGKGDTVKIFIKEILPTEIMNVFQRRPGDKIEITATTRVVLKDKELVDDLSLIVQLTDKFFDKLLPEE
jgi:hypothetical protein